MRGLSAVLLCSTLLIGACSASASAPSDADGEFVRELAMSASATMDLADQGRARAESDDVRSAADEVFEAVAPVVDQLAELSLDLAEDGAGGFAHDDSEGHNDEQAHVDRAALLRSVDDASFDEEFMVLLTAELNEGQALASEASDSVTDQRTKDMASSTAAAWSELIERVDGK